MSRERFQKRLTRMMAHLASLLKAKRSKRPDPYAGRYVKPGRRTSVRPIGISARQWKKLCVAGKNADAAEATRIFKSHTDSAAAPGHPFRETGVPAWRRSRRPRSKNRCARVWQGGAE